MSKIKSLNDPFEGIFELILEDPNNPMTRYANYVYQRDVIDSSSVYSLSEDNSNILLWAHYADNHKGICIEFSTMNLNSIFSTIKRMNYSSTVPVIHRNQRAVSELANDIFLNKTIDWSYEKEWRIISSGNSYYKPIIESDITGVIIGERISQIDREWVIDWLKGYKNVKIYQCRMSKSSYKMDIELIK
ncbi:MAG: DUF2971 domain-containing protein [Desulfosporosinus sp.]|nr:DUF2971 domain-containing protein [Desulfosporosinus sp.]